MAYHSQYQKLLWSLLRATDFSGQKKAASHCVIDRYSGIEFAFAQTSLSPCNDNNSFWYRLSPERRVGGWWHFSLVACDKIQNCPTLLIRSWESLIEQFNTFRHEKSINTQKWDFNPHFHANVALKIYIFWRIYIIKKNKSLYTYIQVLVFFISLG